MNLLVERHCHLVVCRDPDPRILQTIRGSVVTCANCRNLDPTGTETRCYYCLTKVTMCTCIRSGESRGGARGPGPPPP